MPRHASRPIRRLSALGASVLGAIALAVVGLTACGGGSEVVARVGAASITKATLDHWIPIQAILTHELKPGKPVPRGVVPDPPDYTACIARLRSVPATLVVRGPKPTAAQLKDRCRRKYQTLREEMMSFLITAGWLSGAGAELGLQETDAEIKQRLERVRKNEFPRKGEYERHLALTGETVADQLLRNKMKVMSEKIERKLASQGPTAQQQFFKEFSKKWAARTSCRTGYVVPDCKQYKGPLPPEPHI